MGIVNVLGNLTDVPFQRRLFFTVTSIVLSVIITPS